MRRDPLSSVHDQCMTKEREEVPMAIVGGLDVHRRQITFDYLDTETGQVRRGRVAPGGGGAGGGGVVLGGGGAGGGLGGGGGGGGVGGGGAGRAGGPAAPPRGRAGPAGPWRP